MWTYACEYVLSYSTLDDSHTVLNNNVYTNMHSINKEIYFGEKMNNWSDQSS